MRIVLLSFIALLPELLGAQSFFAIRDQRKYILTGGTGISTYYGDLVNPGVLLKPNFNMNVGLMKYYTQNISARVELNWFILKGSDNSADEKGRQQRGLAFHEGCLELSVTGAVNLYGSGIRYYRRPTYNIYAFGGVGLLYFNPKGDYKGKSYALEPLHTEGASYSRVTPVIPFGIGVRYKVSPNVNIVVEGGYRKTFTDYLDDVSGKYLDVTKISDPIAKYFANPYYAVNGYGPGSIRGNPHNTDSYFLLNAKIEYYLPHKGRDINGLIIKKKSQFRYNRRGGRRR